jgi:hypothetical protein
VSAPTVRKFPRTLAEAFPADARHAYAIERGSRRMDSVGSVLLACAIGIGLALAVAHWWSA